MHIFTACHIVAHVVSYDVRITPPPKRQCMPDSFWVQSSYYVPNIQGPLQKVVT